MSVAALNIWTDIDLVPQARQLLAERNIVLHVELEGSLAGVVTADAIIAGSRLVGDAALFTRAPRIRAPSFFKTGGCPLNSRRGVARLRPPRPRCRFIITTCRR